MPEQFMQQVQFDGPPLPCHKTIPLGGVMAEAVSMCAGALIFMKNSCKSAQHPEYGDVLERVELDSESVFQWPQEFLDHHKDPEAWMAKAIEKLKGRA